MENPFRQLKAQWLEKITLAIDYKRKHFDDDAKECMRFFNGPYDFMYGLKYRTGSSGFVFAGDDDMPRPSFCMTVNKVAEMVEIFGPVLYHRNPIRQVNPRKVPQIPIEIFGNPDDPYVQQTYMPIFQQVEQERHVDKARAGLLEFYLNYTPTALDLKSNSRNAIDEAIIKGLGTLWHEVYQPVGSDVKMVGSFFDTVDNLVIDPDLESLEGAKWIARRCVHPVWEVERMYGMRPGSLKGSLESNSQQATVNVDQDGDYRRKQGVTNDLVVYWKIYSKMGLGNRLMGARAKLEEAPDFESFGDWVFLAVCDTCEHPLNIPPQIWQDQNAIQQAIQWETPFWADDSWPFTPLAFHWVPREVYPMSHLKPGMGELKFINWAYSFLAGKIRSASRDFIAVMKAAGEEIKNTILKGTDYELIEIEKAHGTINEVVQFLQHPPFHSDIWTVIQAVETNFEKRVGLTELMYGESASQLRSASEAQLKGNQLQIRPDDMANKVEDAMSEAAKKEAFMARWHLDPQDVAPLMGQIGAHFWGQLVAPADLSQIIHQLEYRIEAGSARKPNKDRDAANMNQAMQNILPILQGWAQATGDVSTINALLHDWAKSIDLDETKYLIKPPPPPPEQQGPTPEQMEAQAKQQDMQMDQERHQEDLDYSEKKHKQELKHQKEKHKASIANGST